MRLRIPAIFAAFVAVLFEATLAPAQAPAPPLTAAAWRHDLDLFVAQFSRGQKDFPKLYRYRGFYSTAGALMNQAGTVSDGETVLGLMRLVASANVAHTMVQTPVTMGFLERLPVTLRWYPDGLAVTGAAAEYSDAIGARVVSIGPMTPNQLLDSVAPFISHENQEWLREQAPALLMKLSMLRHLELLGSDGRAVFTLAKPGGALFTMPVAIGDPRVVQLGMADGPPHAPVPLSRSRPASYYWFRYLEESRTVYIQINRCEEDPALPFARFAHEALAAVAARKARRVVVDLRQNGGGNSEVIRPLERGLDHARLRGRIFVLVGPSTYSSALMNALQLRADAHATLVGEPMGEKPNTYGEIRSITLPNSQLRIWYTTKFFQQAPEGDPDEVRPDIPAAANLADDLAGRDPALDAALAAAVPAAR